MSILLFAAGGHKLVKIQRKARSTQAEIPGNKKSVDVEHILIVDDEIEFVRTVRRHLKRLGFNPDFAFNGEVACHKMLALQKDERCYDLVITDVIMPKMDGFTLLEWIQTTFPQTSVMVVSEFMDHVSLETRVRPELDDIGMKPMTPELMIELIENISKKRAKWQQTGHVGRVMQ